MNRTITKIDKFHKTRRGKLAFGVVELIIAYLVISWAVDSGEIWQYAVAILLLIGGVVNFVKAIKS